MPSLIDDFELPPEYFEEYCSGKARKLPRSTEYHAEADKYEVIIVGAGPAGLLLRLLLARFGLGDESVLCLDSNSGPTRIGRADAFNHRTREMLATLGLDHGITRHGCMVAEEAEYRRTGGQYTKIMQRPYDVRFNLAYCLHQGRFERLLLDDLRHYSGNGVQYLSTVSGVALDDSDAEYPVTVDVCTTGETRQLRAKYVVGTDGAHSIVRRSLGVKMEGNSTDEIWGVMDFVPESDLPDVRRMTRFSGEDGVMTGFIVPREKLSDGNHQIRFYVDMKMGSSENNQSRDAELRDNIRRKKLEIRRDYIIQQISDLVAPFEVKLKPGTKPIWWTVFGVGQRLADKFVVCDRWNHPRVFLAGDACHTHSPLQGQGLNISVQDTFYLSWRLAYAVLGLTKDPAGLLSTYEEERRPWAERVVSADKRWNLSGQSWQDAVEEIQTQTTGCGIQEQAGLLTSTENRAVSWRGKNPILGVLRTGRRLANAQIKRWADGVPSNVYDDFVSDGRYRILMLAAKDFPYGRSGAAMNALTRLTKRYIDSIVELVLIQPHNDDIAFSWADIPIEVKQQAEMNLHYADAGVYDLYGASLETGTIALVRPDGVVAITVNLEEVDLIQDMLDRVLAFQPHAYHMVDDVNGIKRADKINGMREKNGLYGTNGMNQINDMLETNGVYEPNGMSGMYRLNWINSLRV